MPPVTLCLQGLWIWPDTNFHWCRHDTNKLWSHKPGQTPIKDEDNNGQPITDPAKVNIVMPVHRTPRVTRLSG